MCKGCTTLAANIATPNARTDLLAWVSDLVTGERRGFINLNREIFEQPLRTDLIHSNLKWQKTYRNFSMQQINSRGEMSGGGRKPWPQNSGRARAGSVRSPLFKNGGSAKPRCPRAYFYMLDGGSRLKGLCTALTIKYFQVLIMLCSLIKKDTISIVENLETNNTKQFNLSECIKNHEWGYTNLFVDQ
ncbi:MAG: 54S ribosomal protein L4 mitochondrial [Paramarteilia canceri]